MACVLYTRETPPSSRSVEKQHGDETHQRIHQIKNAIIKQRRRLSLSNGKFLWQLYECASLRHRRRRRHCLLQATLHLLTPSRTTQTLVAPLSSRLYVETGGYVATLRHPHQLLPLLLDLPSLGSYSEKKIISIPTLSQLHDPLLSTYFSSLSLTTPFPAGSLN